MEDSKICLIDKISEMVRGGRAPETQRLVREALEASGDAGEILEKGLLPGILAISERFRGKDFFVPETLLAARAFKFGLAELKPRLEKQEENPAGRVVVGTIEGDVHDIGKDLVSTMMRASGFLVEDVGSDAPADLFIDRAEAIQADIICISALLTTTRTAMEKVISRLKERGLREKYAVMVGGCPVSQSFAYQIGADYYTEDALSCSRKAGEIMKEKAEGKLWGK